MRNSSRSSAESPLELCLAPGAAEALARAGLSRRSFIKGSGVLIVGFSVGEVLGALEARAQFGGRDAAPDSPPAGEVDSWISVGADGSVTAYTGKEELGQGMSTAQIQLVAEELCVPVERVNLVAGDTSCTPDQGVTRAVNRIRQISTTPTWRRLAPQLERRFCNLDRNA